MRSPLWGAGPRVLLFKSEKVDHVRGSRNRGPALGRVPFSGCKQAIRVGNTKIH